MKYYVGYMKKTCFNILCETHDGAVAHCIKKMYNEAYEKVGMPPQAEVLTASEVEGRKHAWVNEH